MKMHWMARRTPTEVKGRRAFTKYPLEPWSQSVNIQEMTRSASDIKSAWPGGSIRAEEFANFPLHHFSMDPFTRNEKLIVVTTDVAFSPVTDRFSSLPISTLTVSITVACLVTLSFATVRHREQTTGNRSLLEIPKAADDISGKSS